MNLCSFTSSSWAMLLANPVFVLQITQEQFVLASRSLHLQQAGCGAAYPVGLYGWRKRCIYFFLLLLLATMIVNLALTVWIMKVMNFSLVSTAATQTRRPDRRRTFLGRMRKMSAAAFPNGEDSWGQFGFQRCNWFTCKSNPACLTTPAVTCLIKIQQYDLNCVGQLNCFCLISIWRALNCWSVWVRMHQLVLWTAVCFVSSGFKNKGKSHSSKLKRARFNLKQTARGLLALTFSRDGAHSSPFCQPTCAGSRPPLPCWLMRPLTVAITPPLTISLCRD